MEILILHPGALGDLILSLPALHRLKTSLPGCRLTLSGNLDFVRVICGGIIDKNLSLSSVPLHRLYTDKPLPEEDLRFWTSFDRVVSWTGAGDVRLERRLTEIHPMARIATWKPAPDEQRHVSRIFADSLIPWIPEQVHLTPPRVNVSQEDLRCGEEWLQRCGKTPAGFLIALHPGAGSPAKRWPIHRFKTLGRDLLRDNRLSLLLIEGPAEPDAALELARALPASRVAPAVALPLSTLAAVLTRCCAYVGNDSGISHLAAALGVPSIVLFGPTQPRHWGPLGDRVRILRRISGCAACEGKERLEHSCLGSIAVEEVLAILSELRS